MNQLFAVTFLTLTIWLCIMTSVYRHKWVIFLKNGRAKDVLFDLMIWDKRLKSNPRARIKKCIKTCVWGLLTMFPEILIFVCIRFAFDNAPIARIFAYFLLALAIAFEYHTTCADVTQNGKAIKKTGSRPFSIWCITLCILIGLVVLFCGIFSIISNTWVETQSEEIESNFEIVSIKTKNYYDSKGDERELYEIVYKDENGQQVVINADSNVITVKVSNETVCFNVKTIYKYEKKLVYTDSQFQLVGEEVKYALCLNAAP